MLLSGALGVVVVLALIGVLSARRERLRAPDRLAEAQEAFRQGDRDATLRALHDALHVPLDDHYAPEDARIARQTVTLVGRVLEDIGVDPRPLIAELEQALARAEDGGGEVPRSLSRPVKRFLARARSDAQLAARLLGAAPTEEAEE